MKKILNVILLILSIISLSSCFWWNSEKDVNEAKEELLNSSNTWKTTNTNNSTGANIPKYEDNSNNEDNLEQEYKDNISKFDDLEKKVDNYETEYLTSEKFIELDDLNPEKFTSLEVELKWKTLVNVDKIIVNFSNEASKFPNDKFTLSQFKAWDKTFLYRAFSKYETLDYWKNEYIIEAYSWNEISKLKLTINIYKEEEKNSIKIDENGLPTSTEYGNPVTLGSWKITYSDIKWLEIQQIESDISITNSEELNTFLVNKLDSWYYWNTLRPISGSTWVSFYVIRLDSNDSYIYEKHYYTPDGYYWVLFLESGTWVNKENISAKNRELAEKNSEFITVALTDKLFKDLLK